MKKILFFLLGISGLNACIAQSPVSVMMNQTGFYPDAPKIAAASGLPASTGFHIIDQRNNKIIYSGKAGEERKSNNSSTTVRLLDFTPVKNPGLYLLKIDGNNEPVKFGIAVNVHQPLAMAAVKSYYHQRVSMPLTAPFAGKWARPAGHPDTEVIIHPSAASTERPAGSKISTPMGWYDAGDYNKYIVNSGITMGTMMSAYEDFSSWYDTIQLNIPESVNKVPDLLDEIIYNLRWMLSMQDPNDGGVYNKCTNAAFDGTVMPGVTKLPRYVVQKGTAATLDFAAVTAQAARILKKFNQQLPGLSDSCLKAAELAWNWSIQHPDLRYNQDSINKVFKPAITTGGYGDRNFDDEWFWAATELLVTTGKERYIQGVTKGFLKKLTVPSWANVQMLGVYTLLRADHSKLNNKILPVDVVESLKENVLRLANDYLAEVPGNAFLTVMGGRKSDFNWGSNSNAANQGILMIKAYQLSGDKKYLDAGLSNLDYILGRNATGYSFVTGVGTKTTMNPHHRPSAADGVQEPVPGMLAGGPNPGMQDKCTYLFKEPETAYVDDYCSYASNEIAINWNAPLVYLAGALEAIHQSAATINTGAGAQPGKPGAGQAISFKPAVIANEAYETVAAFDVDHDGNTDLVSGAWWYAGPSFKNRSRIGEVRKEGEFYDDFSTIPIDVNNDGYLDFVTGGWWGNTVRWRENPKGKKTEWKEHVIAECGNVETTRGWDVDNDGVIEIIPNNPGRPLKCFRLDKGTGKFTEFTLHDKQGHGFGFGDINGDGRGDFVLPDGWLEAPAQPWKQKWIFHPEFRLGETGIPIVVADLDKDGLADLIVGQGHGYGLSWYKQRRKAGSTELSWEKKEIDTANSQFHTLLWEDIDQDGQPELITGKRYRAHDDKDPGANDDYGLYYYKWNGKAFDKNVIAFGPKGKGKGTGNYFVIADLRRSGRKGIAVAGKDGLWVFYNDSPAR